MGRRSPRVLAFNVLYVRLTLKPLCGLAHRKNPSFTDWKLNVHQRDCYSHKNCTLQIRKLRDYLEKQMMDYCTRKTYTRYGSNRDYNQVLRTGFQGV
jgi:hypothetical protein